jgi:UDP-N-acetylmuramate dehydrogenase
MSETIEKVVVMDYKGNRKILYKKDIKFNYRKSSLAKYIILSSTFKLRKAKKGEIDARINKYVKARLSSQESRYPNAGCIFKNPSFPEPAGRLIDLCFLKDKLIGGACVSAKHANFIVNRSNAKARDVLKLIRLIQTKVKKRFGINLEPEIKIWR